MDSIENSPMCTARSCARSSLKISSLIPLLLAMRISFVVLCVLTAFTLSSPAQFKNANKAGEVPGPWLFATIGVGKGDDGKSPRTTALKGFAVKLGKNGEAAVCY